MPYEVLADTSVPKVVAKGTDPETNEVFEMRESKSYAAGDVIGDDAVAPDVKEKLEDGDERVSSLLRHISSAEAARLLKQGSPGLQEVSVRDETPTDPNPHVPESAEVSQYQEPVSVEAAESGTTSVAETSESEVTQQEAAANAEVVEESSDSPKDKVETSDSQEETSEEETTEEEEAPKENKFAKLAAKKAPAKKATTKKRTPKK